MTAHQPRSRHLRATHSGSQGNEKCTLFPRNRPCQNADDWPLGAAINSLDHVARERERESDDDFAALWFEAAKIGWLVVVDGIVFVRIAGQGRRGELGALIIAMRALLDEATFCFFDGHRLAGCKVAGGWSLCSGLG